MLLLKTRMVPSASRRKTLRETGSTATSLSQQRIWRLPSILRRGRIDKRKERQRLHLHKHRPICVMRRIHFP